MLRHPFVLILLLGGLAAPAGAYAQLVPPAGTFGAGNTPINGVPFGPNNPSLLSDPSGSLNASKLPPLHPNPPLAPPPPQPVFGTSPSRVAPPYAGASQRIFIPDRVSSKRPLHRRHGRPQVSHFTGICRGC